MTGDLRFTAPPALGPLLARGAVRGLRRPGGDAPLPTEAAILDGYRSDPARLAAYARVCGYTLRDRVPASWFHVLTFPLQAALMAEPGFPYGIAGLVHTENAMTLRRPVLLTDEVGLVVRAENARAHNLGVVFDLVGEARVGGELAWSGRSTYLARGAAEPQASGRSLRSERQRASRRGVPQPTPSGEAPAAAPDVVVSQRWRLGADLGRRYAAVSGDVNPIHLYPATARLFGYKRPLAHGMWTHARALAALDGRLGESYTVGVRFTRPLTLPTTAGFGVAEPESGADDGRLVFVVSRKDGKPALVGEVRPGG